MEQRLLIDSSAAIKYLNNSLTVGAIIFLYKELDRESNISIITKVEILAWHPPVPNDLLIAEKFVNRAAVFPIDYGVGDIAILIRKKTKVKLPDILIAATAITFWVYSHCRQ